MRRCGRVAEVVGVLLALVAASAREVRGQGAWEPGPGHVQVAIWPGEVVGAGGERAATVVDSAGAPRLVGGKPWRYVERVAVATLTVYAPAGGGTGAAVVVFPGGGYNILAIDLEGTEACDWLTSLGITCALLKYRVPCVKTGPYRDCRTALADAQRAVGLLRAEAARWGIDPHRIGVLGFSAGGHMVAALSTGWARRVYPRVDAADTVSCRPDFAMALYPGHLARGVVLNPAIRVTARTPPTLLVQAEDDPVDPVENSIVYHAALRRAGVPVELHLYASGGHAFGFRQTGAPVTRWPAVAEGWLRGIGVVPK